MANRGAPSRMPAQRFDTGLQPGDLVRDWELVWLPEENRTRMSEVWKARHRLMGAEAAVKIIAPEYVYNDEARERFLFAARLQHQMQHPHIVAVREVFELENGRVGLVMPWIDGPAMDKVLGANPGVLPFDWILDLSAALLDALHYVHRFSDPPVVHRDIKPANFLLGSDGRPYLTDFGIAIGMEMPRLTKFGVVGTPEYMSPEQIQDSSERRKAGGAVEVTPVSDLYSFGIALFEIITGYLPFDSDNPNDHGRQADIMRKQIFDYPPYMRDFRRDVPDVLENAISTALFKDKSDRYQSAAAMKEALQEVRRMIDPNRKVRVRSGEWETYGSKEPQIAPPSGSILIVAPVASILLVTTALIGYQAAMRAEVLLGILVAAAGFGFWGHLWFVGKIWHTLKPLGDFDGKMDAVVAAAAHAIPVFNWYWVFKAYGGYLRRYNQYVQKRNWPRLMQGESLGPVSAASMVTATIGTVMLPLLGISTVLLVWLISLCLMLAHNRAILLALKSLSEQLSEGSPGRAGGDAR